MLASFFLGTGRADSWLWNSRGGMVVYLLALGIAILLWLKFQIRSWFGWPDDRAHEGPLRLGLSDPQPKRHQSDRKRLDGSEG